MPTARAELAHLRAIAQEPPGNDEFDHIEDYLAVLDGMLEGAIADREGHAEAAIVAATKAAAQCDAIPFDFGPPVTAKPPHEFAGELLLKAGRGREALAEFDHALQDAPQRALSLLGRARALKASGDSTGAAHAYSELAAIWKTADADLAALAEVRKGTGEAAATR
ncbi:MAG TPA: hypothetical protein VGQ93_11060, partial [Lysobacter sp.]|jgi:tetratricopeptide (TPR) repeat protein|nr:hypothetical protein [Lysobacter sp.]